MLSPFVETKPAGAIQNADAGADRHNGACYQCGVSLAPQRPTGRPSRFCSDAHRKLWHEINDQRGRQLLMLLFETRYNRTGKGRRKPMGPGDVNSLIAYWRRQDTQNDRVSWDAALVPVIPRRVL